MKDIPIKKVNTEDMAACREKRADRQIELLNKYGGALISFTLNIAGDIKQSTLIYKAFKLSKSKILKRLEYLKIPVIFSQEINAFTGNELFISADADPVKVKKELCLLEETDELGRLMDIDVLRLNGSKVSRKEINLPERKCIVCSRPVSECAPQRRHSAELLQEKTRQIIFSALCDNILDKVSLAAQNALLLEAITTPKPGLVDKNNSGAHSDMDLSTFFKSANALLPYFRKCAKEGIMQQNIDSLMPRLRNLGLIAEQNMYQATKGVNTHKGAIYGLGILCAGAGHLLFYEDSFLSDKLFKISAEISKNEISNIKNLADDQALTGGVMQYKQLGLSGARGEACKGFPSVRDIALPVFKNSINKCHSFNDAGVYTFLFLLANVYDSNVIRRKGLKRQQELHIKAQHLLDSGFSKEKVLALDKQLIEENISPGGCADLLSFTYFVYMLENESC